MSLAEQCRGMFVLLVGSLGILGHGALGRPGTQVGVFTAFPLLVLFVNNTALTAAVAYLQSKGAIESASLEPGFYSRLFVTPKVTGGWRPVIDLSHLNCFVEMETAQSVLQSLRPRDWMVSLDL